MRSPIPGVSDAAWMRWVAALDAQPIDAVGPSGGLGSYDMRPRRLKELGLARSVRLERAPSGRQVYSCELAPPLTRARFLRDMVLQAAVLARSARGHYDDLARASGEGLRLPEGQTLAGALAVLHRGGRGALARWPDLFEDTRVLWEKARGCF